TALMILALRDMGADVAYLVPDRFKYGYGLTPAIADLAFTRFTPDLLITVDNGISSHEGVKQAQDHGMQVIITDHHLTTKETPAAEAVVNPNQLGCNFPSKALAGVGVAFYVLANLCSFRKRADQSVSNITQYLDLV
ncbi:MAG TPA: single-stranded-DNA-specific exonuclease RecJ, partial [Acinetobacter radioresistens]|nr:single-stranded-DNA-specific exonuclease RecJ [Acinetobacter radioresistens]